MLKEIATSLVVSGLTSNTALALSCTVPNPVETFNWIAEIETPYFVLAGKLDRDNSRKTETPYSFHLFGMQLTSKGFTQKISVDITAKSDCDFSFPCDEAILDNGHYLLFVRQDTAGLILDVGPCGATYFANPLPKVIKKLEVCMKQGSCQISSQ